MADGQMVLAADMGGTNSRFALFRVHSPGRYAVGSGRGMDVPVEMVDKTVIPTRSVASFTELADRLREDMCAPFLAEGRPLAAAALAIPGPTAVRTPEDAPDREGTARCPNVSWLIPWQEVQAALKVQKLHLINDFLAQGFALAYARDALDVEGIQAGESDPEAPVGLIGAGTGLGHCLVMPGEGATVLPSEAGHCLLAFVGDEEARFADFLREELGRAEIEREHVVSGSGLARLHTFLYNERLRPEEVGEILDTRPRTLEWFARFYARACRDFVLSALPMGGLYITGGLAGNLPQLFRHPVFTYTMRNLPSMSHLLDCVPVRRVAGADSGLWGAGMFAARMVHPLSDPLPVVEA